MWFCLLPTMMMARPRRNVWLSFYNVITMFIRSGTAFVHVRLVRFPYACCGRKMSIPCGFCSQTLGTCGDSLRLNSEPSSPKSLLTKPWNAVILRRLSRIRKPLRLLLGGRQREGAYVMLSPARFFVCVRNGFAVGGWVCRMLFPHVSRKG
jgi:hypothetical protein